MYIVVLKPSVRKVIDKAQTIAERAGGLVQRSWEGVLNGFLLAGVSENFVNTLRADDDVTLVERDGTVTASASRYLPPSGFPNDGSWWGLDRMDQRSSVPDNQYNYFFAGSGVHIYILDTGIRGSHVEFSGRLGNGGILCPITEGCASAYTDTEGHGTQMAGLAAGSVSGVATSATLHSVRLGASRTFTCSSVVSGINWVLSNVQRPAVINMSFAPTYPDVGCFSVGNAINAAISSGVAVVKAAGNDGVDAYYSRDNRSLGEIVVGAIQQDGSRRTGAEPSNFGAVLDVFAPGANTHTAGSTGDNAVANSGGTSGAAAYVTGVVALILQQFPISGAMTDALMMETIIDSTATQGVVTNAGTGSPNKLLYSLHTYLGINGNTDIVSDKDPYYETYTLFGVGGNGTWTGLVWEAQIDGGAWQTVGTNSTSYTRRIFPNDQ